jgi:hypothetical protein
MDKGSGDQRPRGRGRQDFVARYQAGNFAVWSELVKQHEAVGEHPDLREEALQVGRLLMGRVRQNVDRIRNTLREAGADLDEESAPTSAAEIEPLIEVVGPLPIALHAFWTVVGSINLTPPYVPDEHPDYGECALEEEGISLLALDPLQIDGADVDYLLELHEEQDGDADLCVDICPDFLGKQHISGSGPLSIRLPADDADRVDPDVGDDHHPSLVSYLRNAIAYGGFPLLEVAGLPRDQIGVNFRVAFERVKGPWGPAAERLRAKLCRDLLPF